MIVIRVEMWPGGDKSKRRLMALGVITNLGTASSRARGDYSVILSRVSRTATNSDQTRKMIWKRGRVLGFKRDAFSVWYLLGTALYTLLGKAENLERTHGRDARLRTELSSSEVSNQATEHELRAGSDATGQATMPYLR